MKKYNGALKDIRTKKEKARDFDAKETLVTSLPRSELFRKIQNPSDARAGIVSNQNGSGACVEFAIAKAIQMQLEKLGVSKQVISKIDYQFRSNKPQAGCIPQERAEFKQKNGWYYEKDIPSENVSDKYLDSLQISQNILRENGYDLYYYVDWTPTFDETANYIYDNWNALMLIDTDYNNYVKDFISTGKKGGGIRHEICGVDAVNYNNKEYIVFDESWGITSNSEIGKRGQRFMDKESFNGVEQVIFIRLSKINKNKVDYSKYKDLPYLEYGNRNLSVLKLQDMLKEANYMDKGSTINKDEYGNIYGYYGISTKHAVLKWQLDNIKDVSQAQLKIWDGKYFGKASKNVIISKITSKGGIIEDNNMKEIKFRWDKYAIVAISAILTFLGANLVNVDFSQDWKLALAGLATGALQFAIQALIKYFKEDIG